MRKNKVIVGMSGGVDSSVSALLLLKQGYQVEGLFMKNWEEDDSQDYCPAEQDYQDAKSVCNLLEIPLHKINFAQEYWDNVFAYFLAEYRAYRTPNPDVLCNKEIKFKAFLNYALTLGANKIATGHYARIHYQDHQYYLMKGVDANKDQSYFLYLLNQKALEHSIFPIGDLEKTQVRAIAEENHLPIYAKKDSTGICFIGEKRFHTFLERYLPAQPGNIITQTKEILGKHMGLMYYTIGQRQGLGIGGMKDTNNDPWFVVDKDIINNQLIVAQGSHHPALYAHILIASQLHWITDIPSFPFHCQAKIRYRQIQQTCIVSLEPEFQDKYKISFDQAQRAITPGQSIVFYQQDFCLGGGIIEEVIKE